MAKDKRPAMQFYIGDWKKDPNVRACSIGARGLWVEMILAMFECEPRGYMLVGSKQATVQQIAVMAGCSLEETQVLLKELEDARVFSRTEDGTIYSRRMVRDEQLRAMRQQCGKMGGNPVLVNHVVNQMVNHPLKVELKHSVEDEDEESLSQKAREPQSRFMDFFYAYPANKRNGMAKAMRVWTEKNLDAKFDAVMAALDAAKRDEKWAKQFAPRVDLWLEGEPWTPATRPLDSIRDTREADALMVRQMPSDAIQRIVEAFKAKHAKYAHWPKAQLVNTPPPEFVAMVKEGHHAA